MFFNAERPHYLNYGAMGFIIGHEITHGFDDEGRQFDLHGNLVDWWNNGTEEHFLERAKCIIDQYSNFTEDKTQLKVKTFAIKRIPFRTFHVLMHFYRSMA